MARIVHPKVVTGNDLRRGDAVWFTKNNRWSRDMAAAELLEDPAIAATRLAEASAQSDLVVGAYLADAKAGTSGPEALHFREAFRSNGPSNYAHGKQEQV